MSTIRSDSQCVNRITNLARRSSHQFGVTLSLPAKHSSVGFQNMGGERKKRTNTVRGTSARSWRSGWSSGHSLQAVFVCAQTMTQGGRRLRQQQDVVLVKKGMKSCPSPSFALVSNLSAQQSQISMRKKLLAGSGRKLLTFASCWQPLACFQVTLSGVGLDVEDLPSAEKARRVSVYFWLDSYYIIAWKTLTERRSPRR